MTRSPEKTGRSCRVAYSAAPLRTGSTINGVVVVFRDITEETKERDALRRELDALTWIGRIRDAIDEHRLVLFSQPIQPLTDGRPSEELLLRMVARDGSLVLPGSFLPVAEKYGLITEIDRWTITQGDATGRARRPHRRGQHLCRVVGDVELAVRSSSGSCANPEPIPRTWSSRSPRPR